ncbi:hypothetical protein I3760_10G022900 [Carya illinoinensis]|nr:hypothetical protein I3760_10G022900 [Carya illinoinensis]
MVLGPCLLVKTKALKIAVGVSGLESASLKGDDNDQIEVKGDMIDTVKLTTLLRKKVGPAHIISVKEEKKVEFIAWPYGGGVPSYCSYPIYEVRDYHESSNPRSIM